MKSSRLPSVLRDVLLLLGAASITIVSLRYLSFDIIGVLNLQREAIVTSLAYRIVFYLHILGGMTALMLGPFQFWPKLRLKNLQLHRGTGWIYVCAIAVAGTAGLPVACYAHGGMVAISGFIILDLLWLATTYLGLKSVMRGDLIRHKVWMQRSYAVTFTAVTLRIILGVGGLMEIPFTPRYQFAAWACWIINLFVLEFAHGWRRKIVVAST